MGMNLSGKFSETPFSDVIATLRQQQVTGTLVCTDKGIEKTVAFKKGQIIFAASKDERDRLGEVMVQAGKITRAQLSRALDLHQKSVGLKKIGAIFVENGYVAPKDLFNGLKLQVRRVIQSLFLLNNGTYLFQETLPPDVIPLQIDMEDLLREIIQQLKKK